MTGPELRARQVVAGPTGEGTVLGSVAAASSWVGLFDRGVPDPVARGATPTPVPAVVRFRPRAGWTDVAPSADLSVRFTTAMHHASTETAFRATIVDGAEIAGRLRWAEGDTVLVLDPAERQPWGARVRLAVTDAALSDAGIPLAAPAAITFTVAPRPVVATPNPARATAPSGWRWPLLGPITQRFGERLTVYGFHYGIDIDGDTGDPVRAARAGTVVVGGRYDQCGGLEVHVDHGDGVVSWYRHLSRVDVTVGQAVAAGTVVGLVGNTGCSLGSHLHFAIRIGKTFVDPLRYLPPR